MRWRTFLHATIIVLSAIAAGQMSYLMVALAVVGWDR
jgi:hypothetical protein